MEKVEVPTKSTGFGGFAKTFDVVLYFTDNTELGNTAICVHGMINAWNDLDTPTKLRPQYRTERREA